MCTRAAVLASIQLLFTTADVNDDGHPDWLAPLGRSFLAVALGR